MKIRQDEVKMILLSDKEKLSELTKKQLIIIIATLSVELKNTGNGLAFNYKKLLLKNGLEVITKNKK